MSLRLTSAADYGIRVMLHIASLPEERKVLRKEIARAQEIPPAFLSKVLQALVRAGLLLSSRGAGGGFILAKPAGDINLLHVVEAIEGPLALVDCTPDAARCPHSARCPASSVWMSVQHQIASTLRQSTLARLVATRSGPRSSS